MDQCGHDGRLERPVKSYRDVGAQAIADADKIADGFVPYYECLFVRKHPEPAALRKCMDALRDESRYRRLQRARAEHRRARAGDLLRATFAARGRNMHRRGP